MLEDHGRQKELREKREREKREKEQKRLEELELARSEDSKRPGFQRLRAQQVRVERMFRAMCVRRRKELPDYRLPICVGLFLLTSGSLHHQKSHQPPPHTHSQSQYYEELRKQLASGKHGTSIPTSQVQILSSVSHLLR